MALIRLHFKDPEPTIMIGKAAGKTGKKVDGDKKVETEKKFLAGSNKAEKVRAQSHIAKKLETQVEDLHIEHVNISTGHLIMKARQDKGWSQKDLAMVGLFGRRHLCS